MYDPIDHAMVEAVNQIGHAMGVRTIAEYVENDAVLEAIAKLGADYAQGFAIGRPQPLEVLLNPENSERLGNSGYRLEL